jgi:hypothetical protein
MAGLICLMHMQARSGLKRMSRARRGPRYQAWPATSFDAAAARTAAYSGDFGFWGGRGPVNLADERVGSARPCAFNPIHRATFQFQQVLLDARRPAVAHPAASVLSDLIVSLRH